MSKKISKHRSVLMGIAIIWILFFHTRIVLSNPILIFIKEIGYAGVDIFAFLSGMGIFYSLSNNDDSVSFYKRRLYRIAPQYYLMLSLFLVFFGTNYSLSEIIGNIFCLNIWIGNTKYVYWYVQAILVWYLMSPILFKIINKNKIYTVMLILILYVVSIAFWKHDALMAMSRFPVFVIGMAFAKDNLTNNSFAENKSFLRKKFIALFLILAAGIFLIKFLLNNCVGYLWNYGMYWYPFVFIAPSLCMIISELIDLLEKFYGIEQLVKGMKIIGKSTYEIYLIHTILYNFIWDKYTLNAAQWIMIMCISAVLGVLYSKIMSIGIKAGYKKSSLN